MLIANTSSKQRGETNPHLPFSFSSFLPSFLHLSSSPFPMGIISVYPSFSPLALCLSFSLYLYHHLSLSSFLFVLSNSVLMQVDSPKYCLLSYATLSVFCFQREKQEVITKQSLSFFSFIVLDDQNAYLHRTCLAYRPKFFLQDFTNTFKKTQNYLP